MSDSIQADLSK